MARWITTGRLGWPSESMYSHCMRSGSMVRSTWMVASCHLPAQRVLDVDVDLRPVEGAAALVEVVQQIVRAQRLVEGVFRLVPLLVRAELVGRARGQPVRRPEIERPVPLPHQVEEVGDLRLDLVRAADRCARRPG